MPEDAKIYYGSLEKRDDELYTTTSRAIAFVGIDYDIEKAEVIAEDAVSSVKGQVFHRIDIGSRELIEKRVKHMGELRGEK